MLEPREGKLRSGANENTMNLPVNLAGESLWGLYMTTILHTVNPFLSFMIFPCSYRGSTNRSNSAGWYTMKARPWGFQLITCSKPSRSTASKHSCNRQGKGHATPPLAMGTIKRRRRQVITPVRIMIYNKLPRFMFTNPRNCDAYLHCDPGEWPPVVSCN